MSHHWYVWILIGFLAGSMAGRLTGVRPGGCLMTTAVGIGGGLIGGLVVGHYADQDLEFIGSTVVAFVFAAVFLGVLRALGAAQPRTHRHLHRYW